jgi:hypothetical protein
MYTITNDKNAVQLIETSLLVTEGLSWDYLEKED